MFELQRDPDLPTLRRFGALASAVFGALAACAYLERAWFAGGLGPARVAVSAAFSLIAVFAGAAALLRPRANRALYVGLSALAYPIGFVVSYCVLALVFFAVLTPIALALKLLGRDPLARAPDAAAPTYWAATRGPFPRARYFRQF
jgi:hypothetical protein